jgi:hypothetical protein
VARTVLDTVLGQLELTPTEYFQRLTFSLDEARLERLHRASSSRDTDLLIAEEMAPPALSVLRDVDADVDELTLVEPGEEEPLTAAGTAAKARAKKAGRARVARPVTGEEEEDELAEFGLEPLSDDESQFRQAYRRALRTNRRPFRER